MGAEIIDATARNEDPADTPVGTHIPVGNHGRFWPATALRKVCCIATLLLLVPFFEVAVDSAAGQPVIPKFVFSPWVKFCPTGGDENGKPVCQTTIVGHAGSGPAIVAAILNEPKGSANKILRVVVPIGNQIPAGTRLIVDDGQPVSAPYIGCFSKGCMADYEASAELMDRLRHGQSLLVQVMDSKGQQVSLNLPLADFARAISGPQSTDAKLFRELKERLPQRGTQAPGEIPLKQKKGQQLVYSPWTKFCLKGDGQAGQVCFTGKDGRFGTGPVVIGAVLIEPQTDAKKSLRVTVPLGMEMPQGTRVIVDDKEPMTAPYVICFSQGCMADYEANDELIGRLRMGKGLTVQGINSKGQAVSLILPLADFAKAYDNPPIDSTEFEERQRELQEQLKKGTGDKGKEGY